VNGNIHIGREDVGNIAQIISLIVDSINSDWIVLPFCVRSQDGVVGIATGYRLNNQGVGVRVPVGPRIFSTICHPDCLWGPPKFLSRGYWG
jgi:hypothetical protein